VLFSTAMIFMITSCQKTFDAKSYAPTKPVKPPPPPPSFDGFNSSADIESANLLDYFPFNGTNADSLGGITGKVEGTPGFTTGVTGQAYQGAVGSSVVFDDPGQLAAASSFTVSFWMNTQNIGKFARGIFSLNNPTDFWGSLDIYLDNPPADDKNAATLMFKVHMNNASGVPYGAFFLQAEVPNAIGIWTHMVVTYDAGSSVFNIYQNGATIGVSGVAGTKGYVKSPVMPGDDPTKVPETLWGPIKWPSPTAAVIGTWQFQTNPSLTTTGPQSFAESFVGSLDNFRIYNKALTSDEVVALYNLEKLGR
jgi:hypothetical protein